MVMAYEPRVNDEELADNIRRAWRLMQHYRRWAGSGRPLTFLNRQWRRYAREYEADLRALLAVRKAGRVR